MEADSSVLKPTAESATRGARYARSTDERLTLLAVRMVYVSLSFFAACYYFALMYLQIVNENGQWKPAGIDHPASWIGASEMGLVLVAGVVYFWGQWGGLYKRNFSRLGSGVGLAALLGVAAVVIHIYELYHLGFVSSGGGYVSVFIGMEIIFTVILFLSVVALLGVANRARLGLFQKSGIAVEAFGEFWGWVSAIALLNFLALYVQPFFHSA
ncbi:MAG: hypothetical protein ACRDFX_01195 [Chloroflexota bacterium]